MILKLLLKIWPSLIPLLSYVFWIVIKRIITNYLRKKDFIEGEFKVINKDKSKKDKEVDNVGHFSLKNRNFVFVIYLSLILMIISFLFFAIGTGSKDGNYTPAQNIDGKIIPAQIN
jgi:hypothetical protein